jgi:hypothetical protein
VPVEVRRDQVPLGRLGELVELVELVGLVGLVGWLDSVLASGAAIPQTSQ